MPAKIQKNGNGQGRFFKEKFLFYAGEQFFLYFYGHILGRIFITINYGK